MLIAVCHNADMLYYECSLCFILCVFLSLKALERVNCMLPCVSYALLRPLMLHLLLIRFDFRFVALKPFQLTFLIVTLTCTIT